MSTLKSTSGSTRTPSTLSPPSRPRARRRTSRWLASPKVGLPARAGSGCTGEQRRGLWWLALGTLLGLLRLQLVARLQLVTVGSLGIVYTRCWHVGSDPAKQRHQVFSSIVSGATQASPAISIWMLPQGTLPSKVTPAPPTAGHGLQQPSSEWHTSRSTALPATEHASEIFSLSGLANIPTAAPSGTKRRVPLTRSSAYAARFLLRRLRPGAPGLSASSSCAPASPAVAASAQAGGTWSSKPSCAMGPAPVSTCACPAGRSPELTSAESCAQSTCTQRRSGGPREAQLLQQPCGLLRARSCGGAGHLTSPAQQAATPSMAARPTRRSRTRVKAGIASCGPGAGPGPRRLVFTCSSGGTRDGAYASPPGLDPASPAAERWLQCTDVCGLLQGAVLTSSSSSLKATGPLVGAWGRADRRAGAAVHARLPLDPRAEASATAGMGCIAAVTR